MIFDSFIYADAGSATLRLWHLASPYLPPPWRREPAYVTNSLAVPVGPIKRSGSGATVGRNYAANKSRLGKAQRAQHLPGVLVHATRRNPPMANPNNKLAHASLTNKEAA